MAKVVVGLFWIQKDFKKKGNQSVTNITKWEIEFRVKKIHYI